MVAAKKKARSHDKTPRPTKATTEKVSELEALKRGLMKALPKTLEPFMREFHAERIAEVKLRLRALNRNAMEQMAKGETPEARLIAAIGNQEPDNCGGMLDGAVRQQRHSFAVAARSLAQPCRNLGS